MKTYVADTPLNSASITPKKDFVILGGGQAAMDVTTTSGMSSRVTSFLDFLFNCVPAKSALSRFPSSHPEMD
jgi:hypothetical protein